MKHTVDENLAKLEQIAELRKQCDRVQLERILELRADKIAWARISKALGSNHRQAAAQWFKRNRHLRANDDLS